MAVKLGHAKDDEKVGHADVEREVNWECSVADRLGGSWVTL